MKKIKVGVLGAYRGNSMIRYCTESARAEVVAICDKWEEGLRKQQAQHKDENITYYTSFDEFIKHDMDAVVLANYANEHAPFAIRCMEAGKHVFSEVLPAQNMDEAVRLIECVEKTGMVYAYGENYCYMRGPMEMRKLYREGAIGEFEYGECEYIHNCESIWPDISYGDPEHWRNNMYSTFYCTHSLGPIIHITGLRPVSVIGMEGVKNERHLRVGAKGGQFGIEMVTLENDGIVKSIHGGLYENSVWYSIYGGHGRMETAREDAENGAYSRIYVKKDPYSGGYDKNKLETYLPEERDTTDTGSFGHGGSDFFSMDNFMRKLQGDDAADTIDVYEALDMWMPGLFAYFSILDGNKPQSIPNLRNKEERDAWRGDKRCTDKNAAGDQLLPSFSKGTPSIEPEVYELIRNEWKKHCEESGVYTQRKVFVQPEPKN